MSIKYRTSLTLAAAAITSAVLVSSTALARPSDPVVVTATRDEVETRTVSYRDLNLVLASDQRRLDRRVGSAIKDVCVIDDYHAVRTLAAYSTYRACSDLAWTGARPQIRAAIERAQSFAARGGGGSDVASTAIVISARAGN